MVKITRYPPRKKNLKYLTRSIPGNSLPDPSLTLAADYKSKKGGIDSFIFSLPNSTLKDMVDCIGMLRSNFTEARQFAEAIVQWVEINCYCLDMILFRHAILFFFLYM